MDLVLLDNHSHLKMAEDLDMHIDLFPSKVYHPSLFNLLCTSLLKEHFVKGIAQISVHASTPYTELLESRQYETLHSIVCLLDSI